MSSIIVQERPDSTGSIFNLFEAQVVIHLIMMLLQRGVNGSDIGVITLCTFELI